MYAAGITPSTLKKIVSPNTSSHKQLFGDFRASSAWPANKPAQVLTETFKSIPVASSYSEGP